MTLTAAAPVSETVAKPHEDALLADLIRILQNAHAGELAAAYAYRGHWRSLRRPAERTEVARIESAEWHHRNEVFEHLAALGAGPRPRRELLMGAIGGFFGFLCHVGGWFAPMYAAGRLEAINTVEYETARDAAAALGMDHLVESLDEMIVEETRHEVWFGDRCRGHVLLPIAAALFSWRPPDPAGRSANGPLQGFT